MGYKYIHVSEKNYGELVRIMHIERYPSLGETIIKLLREYKDSKGKNSH
jgi:hypothetical protein